MPSLQPRRSGSRGSAEDSGLEHRLPAICGFVPTFAEAGGRLAYGPDFTDLFRRAAAYVIAILQGAAPSELPIQRPTKFPLVINVKTATALGLTIADLARARGSRHRMSDTIAAMADEILTTVADGIATVTLNRPAQRNAMNAAMLAGLRAAFDDLEARRDVRVVVVRGAGPAFCAGMDLKEMEARGGARDPEGDVVAVLQRVERSRHPSIALVHGDAIAGGCELALHCDLRVMAETARIGMPLARIGMIVPFPLGQKLLEVVGPAHTRQLLFTGRPIDGRRAWEIGMVHQVAPAAEVEAAAQALARSIADNAPLSLAGMKAVIQRGVAARPAVAHDDLDAAALRARQSADASEGRRAMLEKRKPVFRGE